MPQREGHRRILGQFSPLGIDPRADGSHQDRHDAIVTQDTGQSQDPTVIRGHLGAKIQSQHSQREFAAALPIDHRVERLAFDVGLHLPHSRLPVEQIADFLRGERFAIFREVQRWQLRVVDPGNGWPRQLASRARDAAINVLAADFLTLCFPHVVQRKQDLIANGIVRFLVQTILERHGRGRRLGGGQQSHRSRTDAGLFRLQETGGTTDRLVAQSAEDCAAAVWTGFDP